MLQFLTGQIEVVGDEPLKEVIASLGGWPVIEEDWQEPEVSIETLIGWLRGRLNQGTFVEQWVGPDDKNSSINIIQVACENYYLGTLLIKLYRYYVKTYASRRFECMCVCVYVWCVCLMEKRLNYI